MPFVTILSRILYRYPNNEVIKRHIPNSKDKSSQQYFHIKSQQPSTSITINWLDTYDANTINVLRIPWVHTYVDNAFLQPPQKCRIH